MSNLILQAKFSSQQSTNNQWRVVCQVKSIFPNQLLYIWGLCYNVKMSSPTVLKCLITVNGEPNYLFNFQYIAITILNWQRWKFTDRIRSRGILQGQICRNSVITSVERFIIHAPEQVLLSNWFRKCSWVSVDRSSLTLWSNLEHQSVEFPGMYTDEQQYWPLLLIG